MDIVRVRVGTAWSERLTTLTVLRSGTRAARTLDAVRCFALTIAPSIAIEALGVPESVRACRVFHSSSRGSAFTPSGAFTVHTQC